MALPHPGASTMAGMRPTPVQPRIEDPVEMLLACHDKVRQFSRLLHKLVAHVASQGADEQARNAALAVRRYFDVAAPLHHQDEDLDLYPALQHLGDPLLSEACRRLSKEHGPQHALWQTVSSWLQTVASGEAPPPPAAVLLFADDAMRHADEEERLLYPQVKRLSAKDLAHIALAMSARRGAALNAMPDPERTQAADGSALGSAPSSKAISSRTERI